VVTLDYIHKMKDLYHATETQLLEFDEIVPMRTNSWNVNSPRLYFLLLTTCGQIEAISKKITKELRLYKKGDDFKQTFNKLNTNKILEIQSVELKFSGKTIKPFSNKHEGNFWWLSHNKAKHELPEGMKYGNIKNVVYALSALFCLMHILEKIPSKEKKVILEYQYWKEHKPVKIPATLRRPSSYYDQEFSKLFASNVNFYYSGL